MEQFKFQIFEGAAATDDDDDDNNNNNDMLWFNLISIIFIFTNKLFTHSPVEIITHDYPAKMSVRWSPNINVFNLFFFAVCDSVKPLDIPYPDADFVTVVYRDYIVQIGLDENYPNATQSGWIAVFNCPGKPSSLFSHNSLFL
jgi:hypothetical protein